MLFGVCSEMSGTDAQPHNSCQHPRGTATRVVGALLVAALACLSLRACFTTEPSYAPAPIQPAPVVSPTVPEPTTSTSEEVGKQTRVLWEDLKESGREFMKGFNQMPSTHLNDKEKK